MDRSLRYKKAVRIRRQAGGAGWPGLGRLSACLPFREGSMGGQIRPVCVIAYMAITPHGYAASSVGQKNGDPQTEGRRRLSLCSFARGVHDHFLHAFAEGARGVSPKHVRATSSHALHSVSALDAW
jgi:hypothetical protein